MDGRVKPGQDGRGSEASRRQPTHSYRYKSKIVIRAVPSPAASTQKLRDLDLCLLSSASLSKHGKIERL